MPPLLLEQLFSKLLLEFVPCTLDFAKVPANVGGVSKGWERFQDCCENDTKTSKGYYQVGISVLVREASQFRCFAVCDSATASGASGM